MKAIKAFLYFPLVAVIVSSLFLLIGFCKNHFGSVSQNLIWVVILLPVFIGLGIGVLTVIYFLNPKDQAPN